MAYKIGDLVAVLSLDDKLSSGLTKAGDSMQKFGRETLVLSGAVAALGGASIASSMQFDKTLNKMVSLAGVASGELQMVKQRILELGPAVGKGPQELADAMMVISSTTDDTAGALLILEKAAQMSATGMGETKDVGKALTAIINSYGKENITAARAADILTQTVKDGGAEADELAGVLANVIPAAAQLGVSFEQVGANIATVTKLGVPAAEAVTQLSSVLTAMVKPTKDGAAALDSIGMSYESLRAMVKEQGLQKALQTVTDKLHGNETQLADVFGRIEAYRNIMSTTTVQAGTYAKEIDRITNSVGAQAKAYDVFDKTASATWEKLVAGVRTASIELGDRLAPSFAKAMGAAKPLLDAAVGLIKAFDSLPKPLQTIVIGAGALLAVMAPLAIAVGMTMTAVGTLAGVFLRMADSVLICRARYQALTAQIWLMDAATKASTISLATGVAGMLAAAAAAAAVGVAVGLLLKILADEQIAGDDLANQENVAAARNSIVIANLAKKAKANETLTQTASRLAAEERAVAEALKAAVPVTTAMIAAQLKAVKVTDDLEEATKLYGKTVTDPKLAAKIIAMSEAQKAAADAAKKLAEHTKELTQQSNEAARSLGAWIAGLKELKERAVELKNIVKAGPLIPILTPGNQGPDEVLRRFDFANALKSNLPTDDAGRLLTDRDERDATRKIELYMAIGDAAADLADVLGGDLGMAVGAVGAAFDGMAQHEAQAQANWERTGNAAMTAAQKIQAIGGAISTVVDIYSKNKENLSGASAAMSGAGSGAKAGAAFGPYGMIIGAVAGALVGFFSGQGFRKMAKEAGDVLGVEMTAGLAKAIKTTMKTLSVDVKTAALLNLDRAMADSGRQASTFSKQMTMLFDVIAQGGAAGALGIEQLDTAFAKLIEEGTPAAAEAMRGLLKQGLGAGVLTDSMAGFVNDAVSKMAAGADKMIEGLAMIEAPLGEMGTAAAQFFVAGFTAKIGEVGLVEAITQSGEGIEKFYEKMADEGNTAAMAMLEPFRQLASVINNEADPSVKGFLLTLQGMGEIFSGLDDLGFVTQDAFTGLTAGIGGTVNALSEAGVTGSAMYMAIAPQLAQIIEAHERYGFVIDESTQKLIDEAEAAGIAFPTDPIQVLIGLVGQLVVLMGGTLPEAIGHVAPAADAAFAGATNAANTMAGDVGTTMDALAGNTTTTLSDMALDVESAMAAASGTAMLALDDVAGKLEAIPPSKDVSINVRFNREGMQKNDDGSIDWDGNPANSFREGSGGLQDFGSGTPAMLHGTEGVFTPPQLNEIISTALRGASAGGQTASGDIHIHLSVPGEPILHFVEKATKRGDVRVHPNAVRAF